MHGKLLTAVAAVLQAAAFTAVAQEPDTMRDPSRPDTSQHTTEQHTTEQQGTYTERSQTTGETGMSTERHQEMASVDTETFVEKAASGSMVEVELARLALQKSEDEEIRQFAERMIEDHTAATEQLRTAAQNENVQVPTSLDSEHQQMVQRLQALEGEEFDRQYRQRMHQDHAETVALFESASQSPQVADEVRQFASTTLPTLQEHREMLQEMEGGSGTTDDPGAYREQLPRSPEEERRY